MAQENPFELQAQQPWAGMVQLAPQGEGQVQPEGGSYFSLSPEAMKMLWAPQQQTPLQQPPVL